MKLYFIRNERKEDFQSSICTYSNKEDFKKAMVNLQKRNINYSAWEEIDGKRTGKTWIHEDFLIINSI